MATAKKTTTKKAAPAKAKTASSTKKTAPKKTTTKKTTAAKKAPAAKKAHVAEAQSFRVSKPTRPFMTFSFTRETIYWLILGVVVILFTLWIMKIQNDISYLYDQIETNAALSETPDAELRQKQQEVKDK